MVLRLLRGVRIVLFSSLLLTALSTLLSVFHHIVLLLFVVVGWRHGCSEGVSWLRVIWQIVLIAAEDPHFCAWRKLCWLWSVVIARFSLRWHVSLVRFKKILAVSAPIDLLFLLGRFHISIFIWDKYRFFRLRNKTTGLDSFLLVPIYSMEQCVDIRLAARLWLWLGWWCLFLRNAWFLL